MPRTLLAPLVVGGRHNFRSKLWRERGGFPGFKQPLAESGFPQLFGRILPLVTLLPA